MKKLISFLFLAILFISCDKYCPICFEYGDCCRCNRNSVSYSYDQFYAEKLIGTWQCSYNTIVGNMELKEIKFINSRKCDVTYSYIRKTEWYSETFDYSYVGSYLRFSNGVSNFSFHIVGYIFPELYVEDSFDEYILKKVR